MSSVPYINIPVDTDPQDILAAAYAFIQALVPGWNPATANLDGWILQAVSSAAAESRDTMAQVGKDIFRFFGNSLINLPPVNAAGATAQTTWTMIDTDGYTIPDGTQVVIPVTGSDSVAFKTVGAVVVLPGNLSTADGEVTIVAITPGANTSALGTIGGVVVLEDPLDFVATPDGIVQTAPTQGGQDAESDDDYLGRLATELQLLAPRPIVAADFVVFADQIPGVAGSVAIDNYAPAVNEIQTITVTATGGTFTMTEGANTTSALAYNIIASALQTALQGLTSIGAGNVTVAGGPGGTAPFVCTFVGGKAATNMTAMTANAASLTGTSHGVVVATVVDGSTELTGQTKMVTIVAWDSNMDAVSGPVKAAIQADLQARRETNFIINVVDQIINTITVTVNIQIQDGYVLADVQAAVQTAIEEYIASVTIGGTVYVAGISDAAFRTLGVKNVQVTTPGGDVTNGYIVKPVSATPTVGTF